MGVISSQPVDDNREAQLKEGGIHIKWGKEPYKFAQHDTDTLWTEKYGESIYGYKNHFNEDRDTKLIPALEDTSAPEHHRQALAALLRCPKECVPKIHADSTYRSAGQETRLIEAGPISQIKEQGSQAPHCPTNKTHEIKKSFASEVCFWGGDHGMGGICIGSIGCARAQVQIGMLNLTYNIKRVALLICKKHWNAHRVIAPDAI